MAFTWRTMAAGSMRRRLAFIVLLVFVSVPAFQLRCTLACAPDSAVGDVGGCHHHHHAAGAVLATEGRCCHQLMSSTAVTTAATRELTSVRAAILVAQIAPSIRVRADMATKSFALQNDSAPPGPFPVPLRI